MVIPALGCELRSPEDGRVRDQERKQTWVHVCSMACMCSIDTHAHFHVTWMYLLALHMLDGPHPVILWAALTLLRPDFWIWGTCVGLHARLVG